MALVLAGPPYYGIEGLELLARMARQEGCLQVDQPLWQVHYQVQKIHHAQNPALQAPWDIAQAYLTLVEEPPKEDTLEWSDAGGIQWRSLPGFATLAEQLASLTLFSLETGYLLHNTVLVRGQRLEASAPPARPVPAFLPRKPPPLEYWTKSVLAWEIGADGYEVEHLTCRWECQKPGNKSVSQSMGPALQLVQVGENTWEEGQMVPTPPGLIRTQVLVRSRKSSRKQS